MHPGKNNQPIKENAETGNASNPTPQDNSYVHSNNDNQLISREGEKYLRESGNIEDLPDPQQNQEMDDSINNDQDR